MRSTSVFLVLLCVALWLPSTLAWGSSQDKVLLEKVTAITLEEGRMTNSRRVSPVQQLECVGGSAGCYGYRPSVVQCVNVGFDGYNVQWECKAEMDSKYRFGHLDVSCEGYDYPEDPYVLRGSCGLRYKLDFTEEGYRSRDSGHRNPGYDTYHSESYSRSSGFGIGTLIQLCIIGVIIYCVLGSCFGSGQRTTSGALHVSGGYGSGHHPTGGSGPGFWTGAATGGALGYLFGGRNRRAYGGGYGSTGWYGGGYGGGHSSGYSSRYSSGGSGRSSSSRTTSGFGGTSRR